MFHKKPVHFPKNFMWGASSSAFQVEGAVEEDGKSLSISDLNTRNNHSYADNSVAADHYHHYKEDVALMAECGFSSYRFSIAWPRVLPNGTGELNSKGVQFYHNLIDELLAHNITPIVTLYHYDLPLCLQEKYGGWMNRQAADDFEYYARCMFREFGDKVKYWLTLNEQNMQIVYASWLGLAKGVDDFEKAKYKMNHIMNLAHAKAVIACHEMVKDGKIGPVPGYVPIYPETCEPKNMIAMLNAEELSQKQWLDLYVFGDYNPFMKRYFEENDIDIDIRPGDMELIKKAKIDFIAVNCYRSNVAKHCDITEEEAQMIPNREGVKGNFKYPKIPGLYQLCRNPYVPTSDWDWDIDPICLRYALRDLFNKYHLPMMITETGLGAYDKLEPGDVVNDEYRIRFLEDHLREFKNAIGDGVELIAFNPWSFTDLLSTGNGMCKRYGLVYVNRTDEDVMDCRRIKKDSFNWYKKVIESNGEVL